MLTSLWVKYLKLNDQKTQQNVCSSPLNLPTQSFSQPMSQHFNPGTQVLSSVQKSRLTDGHSRVSKTGHTPGPEDRSCSSTQLDW